MKFPRNMKFARAMFNGVGLHCPDLTAGTPVYTPDELGLEDPDAHVAPAAGAAGRPVPAEASLGPGGAEVVPGACAYLTEAAARVRGRHRHGGRAVPLLLRPGRPSGARRDAGRRDGRPPALARGVGVDDDKLARLASEERGLAMEDRAKAAQAADVWLTTRRPASAGAEASGHLSGGRAGAAER